MTNVELRSIRLGLRDWTTLYLRVALAAAFLTSVTDRLGIWGTYGAVNVAWGDMAHFIAYAAKLNPWFPATVIPALAWFVTGAETLLAAALLLGFHTRLAALSTGWLLLAFAIGMTAGTGIKSALNASVFSASAGAFLLASGAVYPLSIDSFRRRREGGGAILNSCVMSQLKNRCEVPLPPTYLSFLRSLFRGPGTTHRAHRVLSCAREVQK